MNNDTSIGRLCQKTGVVCLLILVCIKWHFCATGPDAIFFYRNPARDYSTLICIRLHHIHYGINGIVRFKNDACVREYVFGYEKKYSGPDLKMKFLTS